ncbi:NAD(P)/FAD-dependent oxidoreductase [Pendulispora albinea]|uniref:FAD-dependent monooxygenase n=1 Tax=Pendulispora albinea TaxID=2741071 RepID=A0ABZ2LS49_9BACT
MTLQIEKAIVLGAGMAGLLCAESLAEAGLEVILVERDALPEKPEARAGVPQGRFVHQLLAGGLRILGTMFPGLEAELLAAGGVSIDWHRDVAWLSAAGWMPQASEHHSLSNISCTREVLEHVVRAKVSAHPRIRILQETEVASLRMEGRRISGVDVRRVGKRSTTGLDADLVVDASGRESKAPVWLEALGIPRAEETVVDASLGYASHIVPAAPERLSGAHALILHPTPPTNTRSGTIFAIEGGRWIITLTGVGGDYPPIDREGFLAFARSLRDPRLHDAIADRIPGPARGYRNTANRLRRFDGLSDWPDGLLVVGDALCAFNPVYGQGMSVAAMTAKMLGETLRANHGQLECPAVQRAVVALNRIPWQMSTSVDRSYPTTVVSGPEYGDPSSSPRDAIAAAVRDPDAYHRFLKVMHLVGDDDLQKKPSSTSSSLSNSPSSPNSSHASMGSVSSRSEAATVDR